MRKMLAMFLAVFTLVCMTSCEMEPTLTFEDIQGEWDLPGDDHISIVSEQAVDISWSEGEDTYFAWADGTFEDGVFTGTYSHNSTVGGVSVSATDLSITITLELIDGQLKAICSGAGPLNGQTFTGGVKVG